MAERVLIVEDNPLEDMLSSFHDLFPGESYGDLLGHVEKTRRREYYHLQRVDKTQAIKSELERVVMQKKKYRNSEYPLLSQLNGYDLIGDVHSHPPLDENREIERVPIKIGWKTDTDIKDLTEFPNHISVVIFSNLINRNYGVRIHDYGFCGCMRLIYRQDGVDVNGLFSVVMRGYYFDSEERKKKICKIDLHKGKLKGILKAAQRYKE